jgi:hypothetical protein
MEVNKKLALFIGQTINRFIVEFDEEYQKEDKKIQADKIWIEFDQGVVEIIPLIDTDEIDVILHNSIASISRNVRSKEVAKYVGSQLGQSWVSFNGNGYFDVLILGFNNIKPALVILSETSSLKMFSLAQI